MQLTALARRARPDNFTLTLLATIGVASLAPCRGRWAHGFDILTDVAIALLFFLHGAKLSRQAVLAGATHWRLHLTVLSCTFALFPLLGVIGSPLAQLLLTPSLLAGFLFLCCVPSTVQSSIAFTSMAHGNVPAAVVSASISSLVGLVLTPLLAGLLLSRQGSISAQGAMDIVLQLLLPFTLGHLSRPWTGAFVERHRGLLKFSDNGTIVLVVYTAFSAAVVKGLWQHTPVSALLGVLVMAALLLAAVMVINLWASRRLGFDREDRIAIFFCGSKKSLASGIPIARVIFAGQAMGALVLPLMVFHMLQLMVCAVIAQRYARQYSAGTVTKT
ncbi:bile acid:sodium symporter family protein [Oleiagrimonas sp. C23AA]|uniref:bile acid:sodium symporter family protein n=1 Tax=Oleiagrimonas sp. C23AA TaxID=2719047 RepID=UPI001422424A|nr:bile acid:sodium symporter family protein [Oleiagrimonas sp. C23AA]NII11377.1 bile acid:sodium symporter [Oleiagrimonas sp. C23AA]